MAFSFGDKKQTVVTMVIHALTIFLIAGCGASNGNPRTTIKIMHVNDVHSHLDVSDIDLTLDGEDTACEIGGMARLAAIIPQLAADNTNHLVLHAGDAVQGTLYYTLFKGQVDAEVMNAIGFDAMAIGNHEFDDGDEWLAGFCRSLDIPLISSNIQVAAGNILTDCFTAYVVTEVGGERIGIIGLTISGKTRASSRPSKEVTFNDEVTSVQAAVDQLTAAGVYKIILLSHYGYENIQTLVGQVTEVDIVVDGDSHTLLGDFSAYGLDSSGDYPTVVQNAEGNDVCIVQAWEYGKAVGELDVTFLGNRVESCAGSTHLILGEIFTREDSQGQKYPLEGRELAAVKSTIEADEQLDMVGEDDTVAAIIEGYLSVVDALGKTVIGSAGEDLLHTRVPGHEYGGVTLALGSDMAPLVAKAFYEQVANADISIQNAGGVRISISADEITYDTAYTLLPFSNTLFEIEMTGSEIHQVLEDAIENIVQGGSTGSFPYCYALKYDVDATQPYGSRVCNLEFKDRETATYSTLQNTAMYMVLTNNYLATGRDGYDTFASVQAEYGPGTDTYLDYAMSFVNYVEGLSAAGERLMKLPVTDHCIKSYIPTPDANDRL